MTLVTSADGASARPEWWFPGVVPDASTIIGQLADHDRRRVVAAVELGAGSLAAAVEASGLPEHRVAKALGRLVDAGLVVAAPNGRLTIDGNAFALAAREVLTRPPSKEHADQPADVRKVLESFVRDGRLVSIPTAHAKRRVVLDWLAQRFEPGRRYPEPEVNAVLAEHHDDTASLRRYLVDEGFLGRTAGNYWRTGGTFPVAVDSDDDEDDNGRALPDE